MDQKKWSKCHAKGITIYPKPIDSTFWKPDCRIVINQNGQEKIGQKTYKQNEELWNKINELYIHISNKL